MTKDVIIAISGFQQSIMEEQPEMENEEIEVIMPATYYFKNGKHYILYDEVVEGIPEGIKNRLKITGDHQVEMLKTGATNTHMVFEKYRQTQTQYETPFGQMLVSIYTTQMDIQCEEDKMNLFIKYKMDIEHEPYADCTIKIHVSSKGEANLGL
ncbi:MAG: DUF1934 domain-containing protein [Ruminococcus sp.]|nr:DUF1934 domain-containing protein [Ruminococcus sp.]